MINDYIKRDLVAHDIAMCANFNSGESGADKPSTILLSDAMEAIKSIPSADVQPAVRGRWIEDGSGYQTCSNCGEEHHWLDYRADFCDACGADMRERGND